MGMSYDIARVTVLLFFIGFSEAASNYTFTPELASECKEYINRDGYKYRQYFSVETIKRKNSSDPEVIFEMHFAILAASNGHVLLSATPEPEANDPVYEFVIGGGGNSFYELRKNKRKNPVITKVRHGILSAIDYKPFYIKIERDGTISFGEEGDYVNPMIYYMDSNPVNVKYISFTSWRGVSAKFLFDCPVAGENGTETKPTSDSQEVERRLPLSMKMVYDFMKGHLSKVPPSPETVVEIGYFFTSLDFNAFDDTLKSTMFIILSWRDDSITWDPDKFNGTKNLKFSSWQIWKPTLIETSITEGGALDTKNYGFINVDYSGQASYYFRTKLTKKCTTPKEKSRWPKDTHQCVLIFEPWHPHENLKLKLMSDDNPTLKMFKETALDVVRNNWNTVLKHAVVDNVTWNSIFKSEVEDDDEDEDDATYDVYYSDRFMLVIDLQRDPTAYDAVFYVPLIVLVSFLLMSFLGAPLDPMRVWLYAAMAFFITMGLCYVDYLIPCHHIPPILVLYTCVLYGILLALLVHVFLISQSLQKFPKFRAMGGLLTNRHLRMAFCLPKMRNCQQYDSFANEGFQSPDDEEETPAIREDVEEMQNEPAPSVGSKEECAEVIDKTMFVVYSTVFSVLLVYHY